MRFRSVARRRAEPQDDVIGRRSLAVRPRASSGGCAPPPHPASNATAKLMLTARNPRSSYLCLLDLADRSEKGSPRPQGYPATQQASAQHVALCRHAVVMLTIRSPLEEDAFHVSTPASRSLHCVWQLPSLARLPSWRLRAIRQLRSSIFPREGSVPTGMVLLSPGVALSDLVTDRIVNDGRFNVVDRYSPHARRSASTNSPRAAKWTRRLQSAPERWSVRVTW